MRIGQTSAVHFAAQMLTTAAGFVANIYFARTLGSEVLGTYFLLLSVLAWLAIGGNLGVRSAVKKRLSETGGGDGYFSAAVGIQVLLFVAISAVVLASERYINAYIGVDVASLLVALLFVKLGFLFVASVLDGQRLVHVSSLLEPLDWMLRSVFQIVAVFLGFGLLGLVVGYVAAGVVAILVGIWFVSAALVVPTMRHVRSLVDYSKYSWFEEIQGRTFLSMDTIVLGFFVAHSFIGIYEIAWNIASVFAIFGTSIGRALFPEISKVTAEGDSERATRFLNEALAYAGLFIIPGFVGGVVLGDIILSIYGQEFTQGYVILLILIFARLMNVYQAQFTSMLSAMNRPDVTFRINGVFVAVNVVLNVVLVSEYGWIGAAVATTVSVVAALVIGYGYLSRIVTLRLPLGEIGKQWFSGLVMGGVVYLCRTVLPDTIPVAVVLVAVGASIYFGLLFGISRRFRAVTLQNLPRIS